MRKIIQERQLEEYKGTHKELLIHFVTEWCTPCKFSRKMLESELQYLSSQLIVLQVNCDEADDLVLRYKVEGVPTLMLLNRNLGQQEKVVGFLPEKIKTFFKKIKKG